MHMLAPPKVADKPTHWTSPERLSFHEKVALYKRSEQEESGRKSPSRPGSAKDSGNKQKGTGVLPVKRTSSDGGTVQPTGMYENMQLTVTVVVPGFVEITKLWFMQGRKNT